MLNPLPRAPVFLADGGVSQVPRCSQQSGRAMCSCPVAAFPSFPALPANLLRWLETKAVTRSGRGRISSRPEGLNSAALPCRPGVSSDTVPPPCTPSRSQPVLLPFSRDSGAWSGVIGVRLLAGAWEAGSICQGRGRSEEGGGICRLGRRACFRKLSAC